MKLIFAPMEGITGYLYRNIHHQYFSGIDEYFTPFLSPGPEKGLGAKEIRDILPENNEGICLVPQLLTNRAADFTKAEQVIRSFGYGEVNLNLGCPSGTVVAKKKGAGFLAYPDELDRFLEEIFAHAGGAISVKTRIGKNSPEEFPRLLEIFNRYPIKELIIHPRLRSDFYKNHPDMDTFRAALSGSKNPVVYNGDLFTAADYEVFYRDFPSVSTVMLGRGMIQNPALAEEIRACGSEKISAAAAPQDSADKSGRAEEEKRRRLKSFHDELLSAYRGAMSGDKNVLFHMKELWAYLILNFLDDGTYEKKIKKSASLGEYEAVVAALFRDTEIGLRR